MRRLVIATTIAVLACSPGEAAASLAGSHSFVNPCWSSDRHVWPELGEAMASGSGFVRVSVPVPCWFEDGWGRPGPSRDWSKLEEFLSLARMRRLKVLGVLIATPKTISRCHDPHRVGPYACPPADLARYGEMVGELAHRARDTITHWQVLNEPDQPAYFNGTPEDYAHLLRAAHDGIKARVPEAKIVLGGLSRPSPSWMERAFATPGADAARKFDIASVHLRGRAHVVPRHLAFWKRFMARHGFGGPMWVTEHGYPGDPKFQYDDRFDGGLEDQAAYLTESVLRLANAGAEQVFVTLTDMSQHPPNAFSSEGITWVKDSMYHAVPEILRRPAFYAVRRLNRHSAKLLALVRRQRAAARRNPRLARRLARRIAGPYGLR